VAEAEGGGPEAKGGKWSDTAPQEEEEGTAQEVGAKTGQGWVLKNKWKGRRNSHAYCMMIYKCWTSQWSELLCSFMATQLTHTLFYMTSWFVLSSRSCPSHSHKSI